MGWRLLETKNTVLDGESPSLTARGLRCGLCQITLAICYVAITHVFAVILVSAILIRTVNKNISWELHVGLT